MIPNKMTLGKLKEAVYLNAVRLFVDACTLFRTRSHASALALAILSLEELGKLEMIDHICLDICCNGDGQHFLDQLFSRWMFLNHKNKQMWATDLWSKSQKKRVREISDGRTDRAKQDAIYVGYSGRRVRCPKAVTRARAYAELTAVYDRFGDIRDCGFNGFHGCSDSRSSARARRWLVKIEREYTGLE